jgi:hypothetical protein
LVSLPFDGAERTRARFLTVAVGLMAGLSLAALTGAVRAASSLDRFVDYYRPENARVLPTGPALEGPVLNLMRRINLVPGVTGRTMGAFIIGFTPPGTPGTVAIKGTVALADVSFDRDRVLARDRILAGREADPERADEAVINEAGAAVTGVHVGSQLPLRMFSPQDAAKITNGFSAAPSIGTSVTITGIVRNPVDLTKPVIAQPGTIFAANVTRLELTAAFYQDYGGFIAGHGVTDLIRIHSNAARAEIFRLIAADSATSSGHLVIQDGASSFPNRHAAHRAVNAEAMDLALPGLLLTVVTILLLGHAVAERAALPDGDSVLLASMGVSRSRAVRVEVMRSLPIIGAGAAIAVVVAVALSPIMLFGVARLAEIHPGLAFRPAFLAVGAVGFVVALTGRVAVDGWSRRRPVGSRGRFWSRGRSPAGRPEATPVRTWLANRLVGLTERVAGWGAGPAAPAGVSLALAPGRDGRSRGRGRTVPVWTAVGALALGVIGATAAVTYTASLDHFTSRPGLRGWDWDVAIGNIATPADAEAAVRLLSADRHVDTFSGVGVADVRINGLDQPLLWITTDHGVVGPAALRGRLPVVPGEVALATGTLQRAGAHLGGTVRVGSGVLETTLRVVGEVLGPAVLVDGVRLDTGAVLTHDAATVMGEGVYQDPTSFLVRYRGGTRHGTELASLKRAFPGAVLQPTMPGDVTNVERLAALPPVLAGLLVLLGLGSLVVALQATIDRRRPQLATLWAMGFSRQQLRDTVIWQGGALATVAAVIGLPLGALAGRLVWVETASTIGVRAPAVVPWTIVFVAVGVILAAAVTAFGPARRAARVVPPAL